MASYLPRFNDHFPRTRRGHGTTHPEPRTRRSKRLNPVNGQVETVNGPRLRNACACVMPTCALNMRKGGEDHDGLKAHKANVEDWQDERGLLVKEGKARFGVKKEQKVAPYKPAPRAVVPAMQTRSDKCECGHKPTGKYGDTGLELGLCARCWQRGYSRKFQQADDRGRVVA